MLHLPVHAHAGREIKLQGFTMFTLDEGRKVRHLCCTLLVHAHAIREISSTVEVCLHT